MNDLAAALMPMMLEPVLVLDGHRSVVGANPAFLRCFDLAEAETLHRPIDEVGNGGWNIPELLRILDELQGACETVTDRRVEHAFAGLGRRAMMVNGCRLTQDGDQRLLLTFSDVTQREHMESELLARAEFAEKLTDSIREALVVMASDLRVEHANDSFYQMFKVTPEETAGRLIFDIGGGQWDIPELRTALKQILPEQQAFDDFEVTHDFPHIGRRIMLLNARQLDHMPRILLAIRDVTAQRRHAESQKLMIGELQHRVKNILGNVQAIASATFRRSATLAAFEEKFMQRIQSLARVQDLVMRDVTGSVDLRELIERELAAHGWEEDGRLSLKGPQVSLSRRETQPMAMIIHELATNAVKYGAFAASGGRLEISWTAHGTGQPELDLLWREHGVAISGPPAERGFGTSLIERSIRHTLGGESTLEFMPGGIVGRIRFTLHGDKGLPDTD